MSNGGYKMTNKEQIIRIDRMHYLGAYAWAVLFCWTIVIPIVIVIYTEIMIRATKYIIDKNSVTNRFQFLSISEKKVSKKDITDVTMTQGLVQRICKIGNLQINTAGSHGIEMVVKGVKNPESVRKLLK
jgi:uncharacterized membrane protein YdbT with pleckstrin-like domain